MEKETLLKNLGDTVRQLRKEKGLSQVQLAHAIGKDQQSIQRLECGTINPSFYFLYEISIGLTVTVEEIVRITVS